MTYCLPQQEIVLASMSVTRRQMLKAAGLAFEAIAAPVDEESLRAVGAKEKISSIDMATALAEAKAARASQFFAEAPQTFIIGADQILDCDGSWYSKPETPAAAKSTLKALAGKTHQLITAAVIYQGGRRIWQHCAQPAISLRTLSDDDIEAYLEACGDAAYDTPGCYQIEGLGAQIINRIDGCPYAILGLPLLEMLSFLREHGLGHQSDLGGDAV